MIPVLNEGTIRVCNVFQVVKFDKWYDPEGLDIPDNYRVVAEGDFEFCHDWLEDMHYDMKESKYSDVQSYDGDTLQLYYPYSQKRVTYKIIRKGE